jgi:UPF0755 protein
VVLVAAGAAYWGLRSLGLVGTGAPQGEAVITVPRGASALEIGLLLEERGVVSSALGFRIAAYLDGGGDSIQAGRYLLARHMGARQALRALVGGPEAEEFVTVTYPEGAWLTDFARITADKTHLSGRRMLRLARSGRVPSELRPPSVDTMEGLLFPSTYQVVGRDDERALLRRLTREFEEQVSTVDLGRARSLGYSAYEVVIVASMVEAEARVASDRDRIAAVIYNRLARDMTLGIDATVLYALGAHKETLDADDLRIDSPYNTRLHQGLPPTPIGAPGLASLRAAASPAPGEWLYFVVKDCAGNHAFSRSYERFLENKAAYQALHC